VSPRHVPATAHELSRVALLAGLPGETLAALARRMTREEFPAGAMIIREGEDDDRFYVVLSGIVAATTESLGPRRVLRPGEYFGEVAVRGTPSAAATSPKYSPGRSTRRGPRLSVVAATIPHRTT